MGAEDQRRFRLHHLALRSTPRLWYESKAVTGSGTFLTQWGFGSADQVTWMKYPSGNRRQMGEQVNFTYYPRCS